MGKIVKNVILILIGFLFFTGLFILFSTDYKTKSVPISDIVNLLDKPKTKSANVTNTTVTGSLKDSDIKDSATLDNNESLVSVLKVNDIAPEKIRALQIENKTCSVASTLANAILPFLIPFILTSLFIYF